MAPRDDRNFSQDDGVSLLKYLESKLDAMDKALMLAREIMENRLEGLNNLRDEHRTFAGTYLPKAEFTIQHDRVMADIQSLRESRAELQGKASMVHVLVVAVVAVISLVVSVADAVMNFNR